jgi:hypothetical protein
MELVPGLIIYLFRANTKCKKSVFEGSILCNSLPPALKQFRNKLKVLLKMRICLCSLSFVTVVCVTTSVFYVVLYACISVIYAAFLI